MTTAMSGVLWLLGAYVIIVLTAMLIGVKKKQLRSELKKTVFIIGIIFLIIAFFIFVVM
ncbi:MULTISPECIES: hypothetical protein [Paenibacillus]|uniref:hypothetical protein n=1 Tax=Paenibacillus TaxID=44249 RepID=UPI001F43823B|nr:hypothetical protein [Paenibacillus sp. JJ-223]CAH1207184.1 hypothetical protein PAECIP111890_02944 [Paenibacillus sp. JJ-223]